MPKSAAINLAKGRGQTFLDRFLNWALSVGRVVVILTEAIALFAFLYRFNLDRQIIDLHSRINQEQIIVKLLNNNETTYRSLQDRLASINTLSKEAPEEAKTINDIFGLIPSEINFKQMNITKDTVQIEVSGQSADQFAALIKQLRGYSKISSTSVDKIENKTSTATIIMSLTVKLKSTPT
jgi:hypothetical protein